MFSMLFTLSLVLAEGGGVPEWVPRTVNLAIFLGFLYFLLRKPAAAFFEARSKQITDALSKAKVEKEAAEAKLAEVEKRLANLASEQAGIRVEAEREAEAEHERIRVRTDEEVRKISETAGREIGSALKTAQADLQRFVAEKAVELAEATLRSEITDADRKRIVTEYADQLEGVTK